MKYIFFLIETIYYVSEYAFTFHKQYFQSIINRHNEKIVKSINFNEIRLKNNIL